MLKFTKKYNYDGKMDEEVIELCDAMNALPGIVTKDSCCGHSSSPFDIFFKVTAETGLFFLTRCVDRRYWKYGYLWGIRLSVGDLYKTGWPRPIIYLLHSGPMVGEDAYKQAKDLVRNMTHHLNHEAFMEGFDLDVNDFDLEKEEQEKRRCPAEIHVGPFERKDDGKYCLHCGEKV